MRCKYKESKKYKKATICCDEWCSLLTVRGHEVARVHLLGVTKVWLNLLAAGIKLPLVDATGFDVQHIVAGLTSTTGAEWGGEWGRRRKVQFVCGNLRVFHQTAGRWQRQEHPDWCKMNRVPALYEDCCFKVQNAFDGQVLTEMRAMSSVLTDKYLIRLF